MMGTVTVVLHWFLPTSGDSRTVLPFGDDGHRRPPTIDYLAQVARAADDLGFTGVLTPTGTWCEDSWLITAALLRETERLKYLVAFRPNSISPTLAAQKAATYQRISGGRLLLNIVTGGEDTEQHRFGDWLDHDERYDRTDEFLSILRGALSGRPYDFEGRYFHVEGATVNQVPEPQPQLYFGGASPAAELVAARHVDVYLTWGEPPAMVAPRLARLRELAAEQGRTLRFGIRLHVITRDRAADAWLETERFLDAVDPKVIESAQEAMARSASVGQQRMVSLHGGTRDDLVDRPEHVGRHRARARRGRHGARRQPHRGRRPHRGVPRARLRRVHPLRPPAPRGGLLVRRGRDARAAPARPARRAAPPARPGRLRARPPRGDQCPLTRSSPRSAT